MKIFALIFFLMISTAGVVVVNKATGPRGIRNNNPGNIRKSNAQTWVGQVGDDGSFLIFDTPENGIRALARLLQNYHGIRGLKTINGIIARWAPPSENNTFAYASVVAESVGIKANKEMDAEEFNARLPKLVAAIIKHENGQQPYMVATIAAGVAAA